MTKWKFEVKKTCDSDPMVALEQPGIQFGTPDQREELRKELIKEYNINNPIELEEPVMRQFKIMD